MPRNADGSGSDPHITAKTKAAIDALIEGRAKTQREAAEMAGTSEKVLSRNLAKPHVEAYILSRINQRMGRFGVMRAAANLERLADTAKSEEVMLKASIAIMDAKGVINTRERGSAGLGGGGVSGPVLVVVLKHVAPGQGPLIEGQIGAIPVQSASLINGSTAAQAFVEGDRSLDKGVREPESAHAGGGVSHEEHAADRGSKKRAPTSGGHPDER